MWKGDSDFCLNCGQIMPMATTAPITLNCRNCGVEWKIEGNRLVIFINLYNFRM